MPDPSPDGFDPAIRSYYDRRAEEKRLEAGASQLEAYRTRQLIQRHAPAPPAVVVDVGGAAGAYALWLAEEGYEVHLLDPVPRLVEEARRRSEAATHALASCEVGDARALPCPDGMADVVLLLGPLYHLTEAGDRLLALQESARVLRPGGVVLAAAISRWASILDGLAFDFLADPVFADLVDRDLKDGQHRNPTRDTNYFTTAFFHRPEELMAEVVGAGLKAEELVGLEGPACMLTDFDERWADPRRRADLVRVAELLEREPALMGVSAHMLAVGRKPGGGEEVEAARTEQT